MTGATSEPVRRGLLMRAALRVLDEADGPLKRAEVMRRVADAVELTPYELAPYRDGKGEPRWQNHLAWSSTDMRAAGWIDKTPTGWVLTAGGREALATHSDDKELDEDATQAYRQTVNARRGGSDQSHYLATLEAALEFIEPGQWTTYSDLAAVANTNAQTVGTVMGSTSVDGAHRVIGKNGRPVPGFAWRDGREMTQREALEAEGVQFDASGAASESQHVRTEDLCAFLEDAGVLVPLPKRAWLIRGSSVDGHDLIPSWSRDGMFPCAQPSFGR